MLASKLLRLLHTSTPFDRDFGQFDFPKQTWQPVFVFSQALASVSGKFSMASLVLINHDDHDEILVDQERK